MPYRVIRSDENGAFIKHWDSIFRPPSPGGYAPRHTKHEVGQKVWVGDNFVGHSVILGLMVGGERWEQMDGDGRLAKYKRIGW